MKVLKSFLYAAKPLHLLGYARGVIFRILYKTYHFILNLNLLRTSILTKAIYRTVTHKAFQSFTGLKHEQKYFFKILKSENCPGCFKLFFAK